MIRAVHLAAFLAVATGSTALAAPQSEYQGTPAQRASCRPDVYRLCAGEIPNVRAITACLRKNYSRLSAGCAAVFAGSSQ
jgi:hypothetical protein